VLGGTGTAVAVHFLQDFVVVPVGRKLTIGLNLADRTSCYGVLDEEGEVIGRGEAQSTARLSGTS
jgi:hypothetical protein